MFIGLFLNVTFACPNDGAIVTTSQERTKK
jgi:hypothetical protein